MRTATDLFVMNCGLPTFASSEDMYKQRAPRRRSVEVDFGMHWLANDAHLFPQWRVSYIEATREVYAVELRSSPRGRVVMLAEGLSLADCETALEGWETMARPTVEWAIDRLFKWRLG